MTKNFVIPHASGRQPQFPPDAAVLLAAWVNVLPVFVLAALPIVVAICASA